MEAKEIIARRVARELKEGYVVNLGIGLPTMVPRFLPPGVNITLQSENGFLGLGPLAGEPLPGVVNAGGVPCGLMPGAAMFDSATSFALIRGGHVDITVLGGLQVDEEGSLANWMVPGKMVPGMGGAMDLVAGARKVIVAMEHCTREGEPRLLERCNLPLTAKSRVSMVVTELAVFSISHGEFVLLETAPGVTVDMVRARTGARFAVADSIGQMLLAD
ncbi:MAG: 3-oxoacid CoA-transferase subunit B [Dechloromonas sp.]|nr:3-oxoacid CoA-transferase subunit B [Dechloromonas sp.]